MNEDIVEIPINRCLFRQSSIEMRLVPEAPLHCSDTEEEPTGTPRIIGAIPKIANEEDAFVKTRNIMELRNELEKTFKNMQLKVIECRAEEDQEKCGNMKLKDGQKYAVSTEQKSGMYAQVKRKPQVPRRFEETCIKTKKRTVPKEGNTFSVYAQVVKNPKLEKNLEDKAQHLELNEKEMFQKDYTNTSSYAEIPEKSTGGIRAIEGVASPGQMATLRPKSPRPPVVKQEKEESLWDKLGTLGRKKRIKEVREVETEGKNAIDSPGNPVTPDYPPEEYELDEKEERCLVDLQSLDDPKVKDLIHILIEWINDELAEQRIIVQDIVEDLYDGQVLQKLLERLTGEKLNEPEVTQSEEGQKHKLGMVLDDFNRVLNLPHHIPKKWGVEAIHSKNIVAILYLLVALARHFRAPIRLPEHVTIKTHVVQKSNGQLVHRTVHEHVTSHYDEVGMRCERDAFDTLFDHAPDKLQVVKKSMVTFVNKHLNKINLEVTDLETQFSDGVYLVLLMGLLEGFFVPLHCFHLTTKDFDQKVHNVSFAFELMEEVGISRPKARPEDIVNLDLKSTLRVLYKLFSKYKDLL